MLLRIALATDKMSIVLASVLHKTGCRKGNDEENDGTAETSTGESFRDMNWGPDPKGREAKVYKKQLYSVVGWDVGFSPKWNLHAFPHAFQLLVMTLTFPGVADGWVSYCLFGPSTVPCEESNCCYKYSPAFVSALINVWRYNNHVGEYNLILR